MTADASPVREDQAQCHGLAAPEPPRVLKMREGLPDPLRADVVGFRDVCALAPQDTRDRPVERTGVGPGVVDA